MKLSIWPSLFALPLALVLSGCAWVPQKASLRPQPRLEPSSIGNQVPVAVRVTDRRSSDVLGYRGVDSKNAAITTDQNVPELFRKEIIEGLNRKGFVASRYEGQPGRLLHIELRKLSYTTDMDYWKGLVDVQVELLATSSRDGLRFEQLYRGQRQQTTVEAPRAHTNERLLNEAIAEALQHLLEDPRLLRFLAQ